MSNIKQQTNRANIMGCISIMKDLDELWCAKGSRSLLLKERKNAAVTKKANGVKASDRITNCTKRRVETVRYVFERFNTVEEIADHGNYKESLVRAYLSRTFKDGMLSRVRTKIKGKRHLVYTVTAKGLEFAGLVK